MNLNELLASIQECEDDLLDIPEELDEQLKDKVDAYYLKLREMQSKADFFGQLAKDYSDKKKQLEANIERMKEYFRRNMEAFGWQSLQGNRHKVKFITQKRFSVLVECDSEVARNYPDFVEIKFVHSWDKDRLREEFLKNPEPLKEVCGEKAITFLKWS